jgi:uncharacterized integral membrane protein
VTIPTQSDEQSVPGQAPTELGAIDTPAAPRTGGTRISAAWFGIVASALVLILLLIFILQNMKSVKITFFTASGTIPVGVALLLAAIGGLLLAGLVASLRIWQLHHRLTQASTNTRNSAVPDAVDGSIQPAAP